MKKILAMLTALSFATISAVNVSACSWNTPPISGAKIREIMQVAKEQVLAESHSEIPTIFGDSGKKTDWPENINNETDLNIWKESILNPITTSFITLINQSGNIITGAEVESDDWKNHNISNADLALMKNYHITIWIADLAIVQNDETNWISSKKPPIVNWRNEQIKIEKEQITTDNSEISKSDSVFSMVNFLEIDKNIWEEFLNIETQKYRARFIVEVSENDWPPIIFYLDQELK